MSKTVTVGVIILTLTSAGLLYLTKLLNLVQTTERNVLLVSFVSSLSVPLLTYFLFRGRFRNVDPLMYGITWLLWTAVFGLLVALELDGFISKQLTTDIKQRAPFIVSAYGTMKLYWNGVVHYILGIAVIAFYTQRESHREVGLYWASSIVLETLVFWQAILTTGEHHIKSTVWLNLAYLIIPFLAIVRFLHNRPVQARSFLRFDPLWKRPVDLLFFAYFCWALSMAMFRGLAVQGANVDLMKTYMKSNEPSLLDPLGFTKSYALLYEFVFGMYYLFALYGLLCPGQHWMADFSILHAGAAANTQFMYMGSSLHWRTPKEFRAPLTGHPAYIFWMVNILLFTVPHLFTLWCQRDAEKFGRTFTVDLATPVQTYVFSSSTRRTFQKKAD